MPDSSGKAPQPTGWVTLLGSLNSKRSFFLHTLRRARTSAVRTEWSGYRHDVWDILLSALFSLKNFPYSRTTSILWLIVNGLLKLMLLFLHLVPWVDRELWRSQEGTDSGWIRSASFTFGSVQQTRATSFLQATLCTRLTIPLGL